MKKVLIISLALLLLALNMPCSVKAEGNLSVSAKAAILLCCDSKEVVFSKSADLKLPMASTTKIMTALLLAEQPDLSKTVRVTKEMVTVEGSSMGLMPGDTVTYRDLLYGMLLASGNDAANTTAIVLGGSITGFAKIMNSKAAELGLKNTSFVTPSGLDDENHYTTAYDLALLASAALENKVFKEACSSKSAVLYYGNPPYRRTLTNHNKLLDSYDGLVGVKTGFTKRSGRCLVTAAERDGVSLVSVTLNAPDDWNDHRVMLNYGFENTVSVNYKNDDILDTVPIISGDCDLVRIRCEAAKFSVLKSSVNNIETRINLPQFEYAPLSAGESVGFIEYYLDGRLITTADIYSVADVSVYRLKQGFFERFWDILCSLFNYA